MHACMYVCICPLFNICIYIYVCTCIYQKKSLTYYTDWTYWLSINTCEIYKNDRYVFICRCWYIYIYMLIYIYVDIYIYCAGSDLRAELPLKEVRTWTKEWEKWIWENRELICKLSILFHSTKWKMHRWVKCNEVSQSTHVDWAN